MSVFCWLLNLYSLNLFLSTLTESDEQWSDAMPEAVPIYLVVMFLADFFPVYSALVVRERPCSHKVAALIGIMCGLSVPTLNALANIFV